MKIKLCIVMMLLLSFLNIGAISNEKMTKNSFDEFETITMEKSEFKENGVKLQYKTKDNIEKENVRIKEYLTYNINSDCAENVKNNIECFNNDFNINVRLWSDDVYTYVEIILINKNPKYNTLNLRDILKSIGNNDLEDVQYFSYYKGKIEQYNNQLNQLINQANIQNVNILSINNGCTGTGYLKNGYKVNFALTNYNTGSYIIIGTPIIFAIY